MKLRFLVLVGSVVTSSACSETSSDDLDTNRIDMYYTAESYSGSDTVRVSAVTHVDGNELDSVRLSDSDSLWAISGPDSIQLKRDDIAGVYSADFLPGNHSHVVIELRRANKPSALGTSADVPADLAFTTSPDGTTIGLNETLKLAWTNPGPAGTVITVFPDPCNGESSIVLHPPSDSGSWEVAAKDLLIGAPAAEGECIEVSIEREVPGIIDPALNAKSSVRGTRSLQKFKMTIKP